MSEKKKGKNKEKGFSKRIIITILLILFGFVLTVTIYFIPINKESDMIWIERLYYSAQIVVAFYAVVGAVVGIWQYCMSTRSEMIKNKTDKVNKQLIWRGIIKII